MMNMNQEERTAIGFACACYLDDLAKRLKKEHKDPHENRVWVMIERVTYTEIIPDSWSGPRPEYWNRVGGK